MRAVLVESFGRTPRLVDVRDPGPPVDGVVVRVAASGMCRSDWHAWAGHDDGVDLPHVPGHELVGVVEAVGDAVRDWRAGDRVTTPFVCGCGRCVWCRSGDAQVCPDQAQPGFTHWGSWAELVALHHADANLVRVPDAVDDPAAAALGCRFATAWRALTARAGVRPGEWVAVVGAGGVGLSAVMVARALGARVVALDRSTRALEVATRLGADHVVAVADDAGAEAVDAAHELSDGGCHVAIEAVGTLATSALAVHALRRRGRLVQVGLLPRGGPGPAFPLDRVVAWELDVLGSHGMPAVDYPALLALVADGRLRPQDLVERVVGLQDAARLLPGLADASPAGITVIDPRH